MCPLATPPPSIIIWLTLPWYMSTRLECRTNSVNSVISLNMQVVTKCKLGIRFLQVHGIMYISCQRVNACIIGKKNFLSKYGCWSCMLAENAQAENVGVVLCLWYLAIKNLPPQTYLHICRVCTSSPRLKLCQQLRNLVELTQIVNPVEWGALMGNSWGNVG